MYRSIGNRRLAIMGIYVIYDAERNTMTKVRAPSYPRAVHMYLTKNDEFPAKPPISKEDADALCGDCGLTVLDESSMEWL